MPAQLIVREHAGEPVTLCDAGERKHTNKLMRSIDSGRLGLPRTIRACLFDLREHGADVVVHDLAELLE